MFNQNSQSFMKLWHRVWLSFIVLSVLILLLGFVWKHKAHADPVSTFKTQKSPIVLQQQTQTADIVPNAVALIMSRFGCHDLVVYNVILSAKDPVLTAAQIAAESEFKRLAISPCNCRGYMQLSTELLKDGWDDPITNISRGIAYQEEQIARFGSIELGLAAYNAGPGAVIKYGYQIPPYEETQSYVRKIKHYMRQAITEVTSQTENNPVRVYINSFKNILKGVIYYGKTQEIIWEKEQPEFRPTNSKSSVKYRYCPAAISDRSGYYRLLKLHCRKNC
jgi:hypothetical protein